MMDIGRRKHSLESVALCLTFLNDTSMVHIEAQQAILFLLFLGEGKQGRKKKKLPSYLGGRAGSAYFAQSCGYTIYRSKARADRLDVQRVALLYARDCLVG